MLDALRALLCSWPVQVVQVRIETRPTQHLHTALSL